MSKQIYIDSNGNEIQVSGTVNTADMMPMSGNDSTKVSEAIGDLSTLTTTDKSSLVGAINEIASYTRVYGNTASGAIATFDTSLALPLQDCTIGINAVQESGTPTPSSPKAISGFTGANIRVVGLNLWDEITENGYISGSGTEATYTNAIRSKNYLPCIPSTQYYLYVPTSVFAGSSICWYDKNKVFIRRDAESRFSVTSPANAFYFRLSFYNYKGTYPSYANNVSLNYPATDTAYHAYNANSTTAITWQSEAGTVYGGSLDVTTGVLTVTWGSVDMGDLSWTYDSQNQRFNSSVTDIKIYNAVRTNPFICSDFQTISDGRPIAQVPNYSIYNGQSKNIHIHDTDYTDAGQFTTAVSGVLLAYELATPLTYQLTPTQISAIVGTNNVFADTNGNTSVVYACSLKDYIDSQ